MDLKHTAEDIFRAALKAADPYVAVKGRETYLRKRFEDGGFQRLVVVGMGKASGEMARAVHDTLGDMVAEGVVVTKHGAASLSEGRTGLIRILEGGHPVPDEHGVSAAREIVHLLEGADERTMVICLISGGGSALLAAPYGDITLAEKQEVTKALLTGGADITEINSVRKHISAVKGGRLALAAHPATVVSLIVSDVIGDPLDVIASGPTAPDESTYAQALAILEKYSVNTPKSVRSHIARGKDGNEPETPKPGDPVFERVENLIIANNRGALDAARLRAAALGFDVEILTDSLQGDIASVASFLNEELLKRGKPGHCLISGGEPTVVVTGSGLGGRNMELALRMGLLIEGQSATCMLSAGTDGTDGPTDAAGAVVDGSSMAEARDRGIAPEEYLSNNDSYHFFQRAGGLIITGPTGTNVMDVQVILTGEGEGPHG
jgi:glycerate 2-kinase